MVVNYRNLIFLGSFVKEGNINDFYKFEFTPFSEEGLTDEGNPWPTLVILRYNKTTGIVEIYTVSTSTVIGSDYLNTNTQSLNIQNIVKLEPEDEYMKRTNPNEDNRIIGRPTSMILGMIQGDHANFETYSKVMSELINAENKNDYHLTRLHIFLPKSETGIVKSTIVNFFKKPGDTVNKGDGNTTGNALTKLVGKTVQAFFPTGGNKRTRRQSQRQLRFKHSTRRNNRTNKGKKNVKSKRHKTRFM